MIDLRLPLGMLFIVLGVVMASFGFLSRHDAIYDRSLGVDVNLIWGLVEIACGVTVLFVVRGAREKKS